MIQPLRYARSQIDHRHHSYLIRHAVLVATFLALAACGQRDEVTAGRPFRIGAVVPLTGDAATFGNNVKEGADLAVELANSSNRLPGRTIELRAADSRGTAADALSAAQQLTSVWHADAIIGDVTSAGTHAMLRLATDRRVPLISPAASDPALSNASPMFARLWPSDVFEVRVLAEYVRNSGLDRIVVVYANTDYGVAMSQSFAKAVGSAVVLAIPVEREFGDYRAVLARVRRQRPDAVFQILYPEDARRFMKQMQDLGIVLPILATATFEDPQLLRAPGANRVVFASPVPASDSSPERRAFIAAFTRRYNKAPGLLADIGFDAVNLLVLAYAGESSVSGDTAIARIRGLRNFPGASGELSFETTGDVVKPYRLRTVREGAFTWLE